MDITVMSEGRKTFCIGFYRNIDFSSSLGFYVLVLCVGICNTAGECDYIYIHYWNSTWMDFVEYSDNILIYDWSESILFEIDYIIIVIVTHRKLNRLVS